MAYPLTTPSLILTAFAIVSVVSGVPVTEHWNITSLNTHFMGSNSGIPGNSWPPEHQFASTIDFVIDRYFDRANPSAKTAESNHLVNAVDIASLPDTDDIHCSYTFPAPRAKPTFHWIDCHDEGFWFRFLDQQGITEANFTLEIIRGGMLKNTTNAENNTNVQIWNAFASIHVSANSFDDPTAYLTCMGGGPFSGTTCEMNGRLARGGPIAVIPKPAIVRSEAV